jgi:hypothetical protein
VKDREEELRRKLRSVFGIAQTSYFLTPLPDVLGVRTYSRDGDKTETRTFSVLLRRFRNVSPLRRAIWVYIDVVDSCGLPAGAMFCAHAIGKIYWGGSIASDLMCDLM